MMHHTSMWGLADPVDSPHDLAVIPTDEEMLGRNGSSGLLVGTVSPNGQMDNESHIGRGSASSFEGPPVSRPLYFGEGGGPSSIYDSLQAFFDLLHDAHISRVKDVSSTIVDSLGVCCEAYSEKMGDWAGFCIERFETSFKAGYAKLEEGAPEVEEMVVESGGNDPEMNSLKREILELRRRNQWVRRQFEALLRKRRIGRALLQLRRMQNGRKRENYTPMRLFPNEPELKPWREIAPIPELDSAEDPQSARGRERDIGESRYFLSTAPIDRMFDAMMAPESGIFDPFERESDSDREMS